MRHGVLVSGGTQRSQIGEEQGISEHMCFVMFHGSFLKTDVAAIQFPQGCCMSDSD